MYNSCLNPRTVIDVLADAGDGAVITIFFEGLGIDVMTGVVIDSLADVAMVMLTDIMIGDVDMLAGVIVGVVSDIDVDLLTGVDVISSSAMMTTVEFIAMRALLCSAAFSCCRMPILDCDRALHAQMPSCHV